MEWIEKSALQEPANSKIFNKRFYFLHKAPLSKNIYMYNQRLSTLVPLPFATEVSFASVIWTVETSMLRGKRRSLIIQTFEPHLLISNLGWWLPFILKMVDSDDIEL